MEFSRPEYSSGWPFPSPGDLPNPGIKHRSPALQADSLLTELQGKFISLGRGQQTFSVKNHIINVIDTECHMDLLILLS